MKNSLAHPCFNRVRVVAKKSSKKIKEETLAALGLKRPGARTLYGPIVDAGDHVFGDVSGGAPRAWREKLRSLGKRIANLRVKVADRPKVESAFFQVEKNFDPKAVRVLTELVDASINVRAKEHLPALLVALAETKITQLRLSWISVLPEEIGLLQTVRGLAMPGEYILEQGLVEFPAALWTLPLLEELHLGGCPLTRLPKDIARARELRVLDLRGCAHLETLPRELAKMPVLEWLDLGGPTKLSFAHAIPIVATIPSLAWLRLRNCTAGEKVPAAIGAMKELAFLSLGYVEELPKEIAKLEKLEYLDVSYSPLRALPPALADLPALTKLQMEETKVDVASALPIVLESKSLRWVRWDTNAIGHADAKKLHAAGWAQGNDANGDLWVRR